MQTEVKKEHQWWTMKKAQPMCDFPKQEKHSTLKGEKSLKKSNLNF